MAKIIGGRFILFPAEKWIRRIPFLIMAYTLAMLLIGGAISNSSTTYQHLYIYIFVAGDIFLVILFALLWGKSRVRVITINEKNTGNEQK